MRGRIQIFLGVKMNQEETLMIKIGSFVIIQFQKLNFMKQLKVLNLINHLVLTV